MPERITTRRIDVAKLLDSVRDPHAGGTVLFLGTVRKRNEGREVEGLEYEVYKVMAEKKMKEIETALMARWPLKRVSLIHRYGKLRVGEISVAVAVSSEHRAEAFEAGRYAIDAIKTTLPLWKKEKLAGGSEAWVRGAPIAEESAP